VAGRPGWVAKPRSLAGWRLLKPCFNITWCQTAGTALAALAGVSVYPRMLVRTLDSPLNPLWTPDLNHHIFLDAEFFQAFWSSSSDDAITADAPAFALCASRVDDLVLTPFSCHIAAPLLLRPDCAGRHF